MINRKTSFISLSLLFVWTLCITACTDDVQNNEQNENNQPDKDLTTIDQTTTDMTSDMVQKDQGKDTPDLQTNDMSKPDMTIAPDMISQFDFGTPDQGVGFRVTGIVPPSGPLAGGTLVRVSGEGLLEGTKIFLGSREMTVDISGTVLVGNTPKGTTPGPVTLKAISPSGTTQTLDGAFTYTNDLSITQVSPDRIPSSGGLEIDIRGTGFVSGAVVSFSGTNARRVDYINDTLLRVIAPAKDAGVADVRVTVPSGTAVARDAVRFFDPLRIVWLDPSSGPLAGGQDVTIFGRGFAPNMTVKFGQAQAQIVRVDAVVGLVEVKTPAQSVPGLVDVTIVQSDQATRLEDAYYYSDQTTPTIAAVRPNIGPTDGGTRVRIVGTKLDAANARVVFGTQEATITGQRTSHITVTTPPNTPGRVDVIYYEGQVEKARLPMAFEYKPSLWLDKIEPATGTVDGGTTVTLTGRNMLGVTRVTFDDIAVQFQIDSNTQITATTPKHTAGLVDVQLERDGINATLRDGYTFTEPLEIWGFSPTRGSIAGNTYVHIRGRGFVGDLKVTLGGIRATVVRRIDTNNLYFYTPPRVPGDVELRVESATTQKTGPYPYQYFNPATRFGGASGGPVQGAVNVSVFALGGSPIPNAFVMLSTRPDTKYQGLTNPNGQITLSGPDVLGSQSVTATAVGYSTATIQTVDAENVTIFLNQLDPRPGSGSGDPPPFGVIRGRVTSQGKLSDPNNAKTYDMTIVKTTSPSLYGGNPNPGPGSIVLGTGNYEIITRIGDMAVVALCGVYNEDTATFDAQYMGVRRFIFMSDQQVKEDMDVQCDIPLDKHVDVKLINAIYSPTGPDNNLINTYWNFGFEGYYASPTKTKGLSDLLTVRGQPALTNKLSDVSLILIGGSYTDVYSPFTSTHIENVTDYSKLVTMPPLLDVPEPVSPQPGGVIVNREIRWQTSGPYPPSFFVVSLRNQRGIPVWSMVTPGNETSVRVPEFPDFSSLPLDQRPDPYAQGDLNLFITAVRIPGFDFNQFTYEDLSNDRWEAYAINRWAVSFPTP